MRIFSKLLALLLAFLIGFVFCLGALVGVGFLIYSKVSIDYINETGIANIDTSDKIDKDSAEVSLTAMTLADLVKEYNDLKALGDEATIDYLVDRYGLILSDKVDVLLNDEMREIPVFELTSNEGTTKVLKAITIGSLLGYEKEDNPDYTLGSDESEFIWYDEGVEVEGLNAVLAEYSLFRLLNEGVDTEALSDDLTIASVLNLDSRSDIPVYTLVNGEKVKVEDIAPITVWFNSDGTRTDKIISSVADAKISEVGEKFEELYIADIIGYVKYNDSYYSWDVKYEDGEHILLTKEDGITAEFADLSVKKVSEGGLDDKVSDMQLATVLDYTLGEDGKYYDDGVEVTGIMAVLADDKVGDLGKNVGLIKVGEVAGYTFVDGKWYSSYDKADPTARVEAKGILAALSDMTVDEMSDESVLSAKIRNVNVADVLAYELREDGKYYKDSEATEPITGIMAVIADTPVNGISEKLDNSEMGELIGFTKTTAPVVGEDGITIVGYKNVWLDDNGEPVHVLMQTVSNTLFKDIGSLTDNLTLGEIIEEKDRQKGFISLVPADTNIKDIGPTVGNIFNEKTLGDFVSSDAINLDPAVSARLLENGFGDYTLPEIFTLIVHLDIQAPAK